MTEHYIRCRAKISPACYDGKPTSTQFFGEDEPLTGDGTWLRDDKGGTIVCDPCYLGLMPLTPSGRALNHELPDAIVRARLQQAQEEDA